MIQRNEVVKGCCLYIFRCGAKKGGMFCYECAFFDFFSDAKFGIPPRPSRGGLQKAALSFQKVLTLSNTFNSVR